MMNNKSWLQLMLSVLLCLMLVGCISSKYVERKQYLFDVQKNLAKKIATSYKCSVFVDHAVAEPPFDQLDFLYRIKSGQYLVDYYNGFLASPTEQLDAILEAYLNASGEFKNKLQIKLTELYADYRDRNNPQAVIALNFLLTKVVDDKTVVLLDRVLRSSIAIKEKNTDNLLRAWNVGIQDILKQVVQMLNRKVSCGSRKL